MNREKPPGSSPSQASSRPAADAVSAVSPAGREASDAALLQRLLDRIHEEKAKSAAILAAIGDGISIQDPSFRILYQNRIHRNFLGGHVGEYCHLAYEGNETVCPHCPLRRSFEDGGIHREQRQVTVAGETRYFELTTSPLSDAQGEIIAGIEVVRDITDRRRRDEQIHRYAGDLERLLAVSRQMSTNPDLRSLFRQVIATAREMLELDYSTLMLLSDDGRRLVQEDTLGFPAETIGTFALVDGQGLSTYVLRTKHPGTVVDFAAEQRFEVPPVVFEEGIRSAICVPMIVEEEAIGVLIGHTRQHRRFTELETSLYQIMANQAAVAIQSAKHRQELKASEERYRDLFDNSGDLIQTLTPEGRFLFVNRTWQQALNYPAEELDKLTVFDILHPDDLAPCASLLEKAVSTGRPFAIETRLLSRNGDAIDVEGDVSCKMEKGEPVSIRCLLRDITARKRMDEEKERIQAQLLQAQKMEAVGTLAGGVAHDFNNLLTTIQGYTDLALGTVAVDDALHDKLSHIRDAVRRAGDLTRQLLLFSRKEPLQEKTPVALDDLIGNLLKMLGRLIGEDVVLESRFALGVPMVAGVAGRLEQLVMNLTVNARDAMPAGGRIAITTAEAVISQAESRRHPDARPGRFVLLTIADTGIGMAAETLAQIFDPFFTTKDLGKGTGLGLSVVYGIVKEHGGWIEVESSPGRGTTFRCYLPTTPVGDAVSQPAGAGERLDLHGGNERVLLVEDEEAVRTLVSTVLTAHGYRITATENAEAALAIFGQGEGGFDLLFTDVVLPGTSGLELADELRQRRPGLPVLLTSGYTDDKARWNRIQEEELPFLAKPYSLETLLRAVKAACRGSQPA